MATHSTLLGEAVAGYLDGLDVHEPAPMRQLAAVSDELPEAEMRSSPALGRFLAMIVQISGAKQCFEIGTFTGYSALWVADALPKDGHVTAFDVSEDWPAIGRPFWQQAGVAEKITLHVGPAADTIRAHLDDPASRVSAGQFDFGFIDADKQSYPIYYELGMELLRPGGVMLFDNALRHGRVADPNDQDHAVAATRRVNDTAHGDDRVDAVLLPLCDGVLMVRKR